MEPTQPQPPQKEKPQRGLVLNEGTSLVPKNYEEAKVMALDLSKSEIIPKDYQGKPANCLIAIMMGAEVGLAPIQSLQGIMVVNGRPSIWGDTAVGLVLASKFCEYMSDEWDQKTGTATFKTKRVGKPEVVRTFSLQDAKDAGLFNKAGPWQGYKPRMCFNRARAFGLRDVYADVLKGLAIYEEVRDIIETTAERSAPDALPRRASQIAADPLDPVPAAASASAEPEQEPGQADAGQGEGDGQIPHYHGKVVKVEKYKAAEGTMYRIHGADGNNYVTEVKEYAEAANVAVKSGADVDIDYEQAIGERVVLDLLVPEAAKAA
jgi:hypothetical protein